MFTCCPHNSNLAFNVATLSASWTQLFFSPEMMDWVPQTGWTGLSTHSVSLKYAASGDCFSKRNPWSSSHNSKLLASDLLLESCLISVCKRRHLCSASISSQSCMNRHELRACTLMWLIILITSYKTWHFFASQHFCVDNTVCSLTFGSDLFDLSSETRKLSSHSQRSICSKTKWTVQFSW